MARNYGVQAYPTNYVIDSDGKVVFRCVGFDPDGARVLFSVTLGRGEVIGAVDLKTRKIRRITYSFGYTHVVIPHGPFRGHLLTYQHLYHPEGGSYDRCFLQDGWTGKKLRDVTDLDPECAGSAAVKKALGF